MLEVQAPSQTTPTFLSHRNHERSAYSALAAVAQWIERWPASQGVSASIPSQGTCLGCRPGAQ